MGIYFYLILGIATSFGIAFVISIKGILYHTPDTDNELMAHAAAQSHNWRWPSDLHKYGAGKTRMKDVSILLLAIFQKITGDKESDYTYTAMTGISVSICGILIYLITANYFSPTIGLFAGLLYLCSFWPWQVSLYGGHANIGNLFFLLSIFALQWPMIGAVSGTLSFGIAGALFCFSLFSSSSSYKYFASFFIAASYTRFILLEHVNAPIHLYSYSSTSITNIISIFFPLAIALVWVLLWCGQRWLVAKLYYKKIPRPLDRIITGQHLFSLNYYFPVIRRKLNTLAQVMVIITIFFLLILNFIGLQLSIAISVGFILAFIFLTLPNIKQNTKSYFNYLLISPRKTHFRNYIDHYAKQGITIASNMRGAGLKWIPRMLAKFIPFHLFIFVAGGIYLMVNALIRHRIDSLIMTVIMALVALVPIIWAEITRAPQASRPYSPGLITMILFISYTIYQAKYLLNNFGYLPIIFLAITAAWNLFIFITDIYPARMTGRNLLSEIHSRKINDIYTYKTSYNKSFIMTIPGIATSEYLPHRDIKSPFNLHIIQSLTDVIDGWIAIPPTSSKGLTMSCEPEALAGDYTKDTILNSLIKNHSLDKIAAVRFPTYSTSKIWINEDDITSWQSLIMHEIGPDDLYRGYGWLVHSSKIKPLISTTQ